MTEKNDIEKIIESIMLEKWDINWGQYATNDFEWLVQELSNYVAEQQK